MSLAVLTSGGDAPGMNAAIRAVVRSASSLKIPVCGVKYGYQGLANGGANFIELKDGNVVRILGTGGTYLRTFRYDDFKNEDTRKNALFNLRSKDINSLICLGDTRDNRRHLLSPYPNHRLRSLSLD